MHQQRIDKLSYLIEKDTCDLIAINAGHTLAYLSGLNFHLSERPSILLIGNGKTPAIIFPEFEGLKIKNAPVPLTPFAYSENPSNWEKVFEKAVGLNPSYLPACYNLAWLKQRENDHRSAISIYRAMLEKQPGYGEGWYKKIVDETGDQFKVIGDGH